LHRPIVTPAAPLGRRTLLALGTAPLALPALAHTPRGALGRILGQGVLRAGVWLDSPPFGYFGPDGQPAGMEVEAARDIARSLGVRLELVPLGFGDRTAAVSLGHVHLACAAIIITPERLRRVAFAHPHGRLTTLLATTGSRPVSSLAELRGRRVLVRSSTIQEATRRLPAGTDIVLVDEYEQGLRAMQAGDAAAMALPEPAFRRLSLEHPNALLYPVAVLGDPPYGVALPLGEPDLLRFLNTWVFLREDDGSFAAWHERFTGAPRAPMSRL
jgi:polar amino acid transport system substrate-binding protein